MRRKYLQDALGELRKTQSFLYNSGHQLKDLSLIERANKLGLFVKAVEDELDAQFARRFWLSVWLVTGVIVFLIWRFA